MLLLLIFFLLTSSFIQQDQGFNINLPKAASATNVDSNSLIIYLNSSGQPYINGKKSSINDLKATFLSIQKDIIIKADKTIKLESVTKIMDLARSCNIQNLSIATIND